MFFIKERQMKGMKARTGIKQFFCCLLVGLLVCSLFPAAALAEGNSTRRVVRVAFPEQEGMSYISRSGRITGYNYDYLEKIAEYTGWQLEYVSYPSEDGNEAVMSAMQDLMEGKVDLMGPLLKNAYVEENFELPENSYGTVYTTLNALSSSSLHENNVQNVKNLKVGLWEQATTRNAEVLNYLENSNLNYTVLYYDSSDAQYQALKDGEVDVISSVSLSPFPNTRIIERFAPRSYYFAATKGNTELMDELNEAIHELDYVQPGLQDTLFDQYFRASENIFELTSTERFALSQIKELNVLCFDYDAPYVYQEEGKPKGMLISVLNDFSEETGIPLHYTFCKDRSEADALLEKAAYDILIGFKFDSEYCAEHGFVRSEPIVESGFAYVKNLNSDKTDTIAVVNGVQEWIDTSAYSNVVLYDNAKQCIEAINDHKVDAAAGDRSVMEYYIYDTASRLTTTLISGENQKVGLGVSKRHGTDLMKILNNYIDSLSNVEVTQYLSEGNTHARSGALIRYVRQYPAQATAIVVCITTVLAVGVVMMIYARKMNRKNLELQEANAVRSEFLSRMSHDIRTPMNGILGMLEISDRCVDDPEQVHKYHGKIRKASEYLLALVNDVLSMNKLDDQNVSFPEDSVDLTSLIQDCRELVASKALEKNVTLVTPTAERFTPPRVISSELHLRQVFMNLLGNALQFSKQGGTVAVAAEVVEQTEDTVTCTFSVSDDGIGISKEFQEKMFEPFTQEHGGARSEYQGSGLGLSITKRILDRMGGTIQVHSAPGEGTTFTWQLTFRIDKDYHPAPSEPAAANEETSALNGLNVLAAEDNELNAEIMQFMLEAAGAHVTLVADGKQAVEAFQKSEIGYFGLFLTDLMMPVMDGYEASRTIRAMKRPDAANLPIIAVSANSMPEDLEKSRAAGLNGHISKPIDPNKLEKLIHELLVKK